MRYLFEDFVLDAYRRELRRGDRLVAIEPKVFDFLVHVITNHERVVSKDDLIAAIWKGRIVSDSALTSCINAARTALDDSGEAQHLIKTFPRKGIRFVGGVRLDHNPSGEAPGRNSGPLLSLPDRPSIAVLPFVNMSSDAEQEYLADGVVEEIITALSRMRWLFVIARTSSSAYKGRAVDIKQVGRELGVRYVLEGSVRKSGSRLRITGQLIEASTGLHLWADRFDGTLNDIFDLQDRVTEAVVGAIEPKLEQTEIERARRKPTDNLDAYDCYLRAVANYYPATPDEASAMLTLLTRARNLDPGFAAAYGMAAWCHARRKGFGWVTDKEKEAAEAARLARRAVELSKDDAQPLAWASFALALLVGELDEATVVIDRASGSIRIWRSVGLRVVGFESGAANRISPSSIWRVRCALVLSDQWWALRRARQRMPTSSLDDMRKPAFGQDGPPWKALVFLVGCGFLPRAMLLQGILREQGLPLPGCFRLIRAGASRI